MTEQRKLLEAGSHELKLLQAGIEDLNKVIISKEKQKDDFQQLKGKLADQITRSALILIRNMTAVGSGESSVDPNEDVFVDLEEQVSRWNSWEVPRLIFNR